MKTETNTPDITTGTTLSTTQSTTYSTTYSTTHTTTHSSTHSTTHSTTQSITHSTTSGLTHVDGNAVLITGGWTVGKYLNATSHSSEIFLPNSPNKPCILPELPAQYWFHTQDGGMICGGQKTKNICRQWNSDEGVFPEKPIHEFKTGRVNHVSWSPVSEKETFLIGGTSAGVGAEKSSTTVKQGVFEGYGGFPLKSPLRITGACSIPDPETDTVVITGGNLNSPMYRRASLYNENGFVKNLGNLTYRRQHHGCTSYVADKKRV